MGALLFFASLLGFGLSVATRIFKVRSLTGGLGFGLAIGIATAMVGVNALGYAMPIQTAFWVVPALMLLFTLARWPKIDLRGSLHFEGPTLLVLGVFGLLVGFANARFLGSDPWTWGQIPLITSIMDGNFPVKMLMNPDVAAGYHYGPQLFSAFTAVLLKWTPAAAYDLSPVLCALGGLFGFSYFVEKLFGTHRGSTLLPMLALAGGGLVWLRGVNLAADLFHKYVLLQPVSEPLKWLVPMVGSTIDPSLLNVFGSRTFTFGFLFLPALLLSLHQLFSHAEKSDRMRWGALAILFILALALTTESAVAILAPSILAYAVCAFLFPRSGFPPWRRTLTDGVIVLAISLFFARIQGGVLSVAGSHGDLAVSTFSIGFTGRLRYLAIAPSVGIWEWPFLRDAGLPLVLFPVICVYFWRQRRRFPFAIFLCIFAALHIAVPFVINYEPRVNELMRFAYIGFSLSAFLIGAMLLETWCKRRGLKKLLAYLIIGSMLIASLLYICIRAAFPTLRFENAPLFAQMLPATQEQLSLYEWVNAHTTIDDRFYLRTIPITSPYDIPEEVAQQRDRIRFSAYTGRYAVGSIGGWETVMSSEQLQWQTDIESKCSLEALSGFKVRYLVVETKERADWFRSHCRSLDWSVVYDGKTGNGYLRVYELKNR